MKFSETIGEFGARIDESFGNVCSLHATPGGHRELGPEAEPSGGKDWSTSSAVVQLRESTRYPVPLSALQNRDVMA